ncbi:hypothetical protein [Pseudomonas nitroreducens]|uniref:hypothetical protein n=1 Tax=Pseudomonas nitroreducens TaxID=46680 RepID=UPI001FB6C271|nr:hypothetical protein [Pseudomonas nitroreducens]MCJ1881872.1 hypothetical protein [Pseudomonas nitroreducens]MCJ1898286.1 hypothetical protein [Pseudomonas nitroreducens]
MNDQDVSWYKNSVVDSVFGRLNQSSFDAGLFSVEELYQHIENSSKVVFDLLVRFFDVYDEWWSFQKQHEAEIDGGQGLVGQALSKNIELIEKRDKARSDLLNELNKYSA